MSKSRAQELLKMKNELRDKFDQACKKLDETIRAEEAEDGAAKAVIDYEGVRLVREIAHKSPGRAGTQAGIFAARMLPRRGGPIE
jgi:hypothetical protein